MVLQEQNAATKLSGSSEELVKLVESARSGRLHPDALSDVLSAASLAVGQDSTKQLLMRLIVLIQQQLADSTSSSNSSNDEKQRESEKTPMNASADVQCRRSDDNVSLNTSNTTKTTNASQPTRATEPAGNTSKENEMDKLLAWKNRIENALVGSNKQLSSTVAVQSEVSKCSIPEDSVMQTTSTSSDVKVNDKSEPSVSVGRYSFAGSMDMTSCTVSNVLQSVSVSPQLTTDTGPTADSCTLGLPLLSHTPDTCLPGLPVSAHTSETRPLVLSETCQPLLSHPTSDTCPPILSPASPLVDYPPLPTPPKPPANLLMSDRRGMSCELSAPVLPFPATLDSDVCTSSASQHATHDVCTSVSMSYGSCLSASVPSSHDVTTVSYDVYSSSGPADSAWLNVSTVNTGHIDNRCPPLTSVSDATVPSMTFRHDTSPDVKLVSSNKCVVSEAWYSSSTSNTYSQLKTVQELHPEPHSKLPLHSSIRTAQEHCVQPRTATRLQSPATWLSQLASPSVFVSNVLKSHSRPEHRMFDNHKSETSRHSVYCGQHVLPSRTADHRPFAEHSDLSTVSHSEFTAQLNPTVDDIQLKDFDNKDFNNVVSDSKLYVPESKQQLETEYRMSHGIQSHSGSKGCVPESKQQLETEYRSSHGIQYQSDSFLRTSTNEVLMKLAGMPVDCALPPSESESRVAVVIESDANTALTTLTAGSAHVERSSQTADCDKTSGSKYATETSGNRTPVGLATSPTVDQVTSSTANATHWHSPPALCAVTVQQTPCDQQRAGHEEIMNDNSDLEEGEIVDDSSPTPTTGQRELPQATKQLLFFLKTDPVRKSSSSQGQQPRVTAANTSRRRQNDRREDLDKQCRTNSSSRRRW